MCEEIIALESWDHMIRQVCQIENPPSAHMHPPSNLAICNYGTEEEEEETRKCTDTHRSTNRYRENNTDWGVSQVQKENVR